MLSGGLSSREGKQFSRKNPVLFFFVLELLALSSSVPHHQLPLSKDIVFLCRLRKEESCAAMLVSVSFSSSPNLSQSFSFGYRNHALTFFCVQFLFFLIRFRIPFVLVHPCLESD
jgi:hypothetical protein